MEVTFDARFLGFGLEPFGALCKISNFTIFKTLLLSQFSPNSSKLYTRYPKHRAIQAITFFFGDLPKIKKKYGILNIFLNTGHYAAGNFKMLFLPKFSM